MKLVKMYYLLLLMLLTILSGCNMLNSKGKVRDFIPGTYVSAWSSSYSQTRDTLLIEPITEDGSVTYTITRRTYIEYNASFKKREPEYKIERWMGSYDPGAKTVVIENSGRILSFDPDKQEMKMGIVAYKQL